MAKNIVLYHNNCDDGFGAAWSAWKKFGTKARYIGVQYSEPLPEGLEDKNVYMLDFCYPPEIIKKLLKTTNRLVVIDHHTSNNDAVRLVPESIFNGNFTRSGATLAWEYFHPKKKTPKLLKYVEDIDLWRNKVSYSNEISAFLRSYEKNFKLWDKIARNIENPKKRKENIEEGKAIIRSDQEKVERAVDNAEIVEFCGYKTLASNSLHLSSHVGAELYKKMPPIAIIWSRRKNMIIVSLRSNGKVDVSKLAKKFGGGGHKVAAAFRLKPTDKLPWKVISDKM